MSDELSQDDLLKAAFGFHDALVAYAYALLRDHALAEKICPNYGLTVDLMKEKRV